MPMWLESGWPVALVANLVRAKVWLGLAWLAQCPAIPNDLVTS